MTRVIVVEPDPRVRDSLQARRLAPTDALTLTASMEEAQEHCQQAERSLVIVRNTAGPEAAAAAACGFDLAAGPLFVRLVMLATASSSRFVHEAECIVAELSLPPLPSPHAALDGLPGEFPHASYFPLARVGRARCADILLVRNRILGAKELLVQVDEDPAGAWDVAEALYRDFKSRPVRPAGLLRHELTRDHSYIAAGPLPLEFAREVDHCRSRQAA